MANLFLTNKGEFLFGTYTSYTYEEQVYAGATRTDICRIGTGTLSRILPLLHIEKFEEITDLTFARSLMAPFYVIDCDEVITPP